MFLFLKIITKQTFNVYLKFNVFKELYYQHHGITKLLDT